MRLVIFVGAMVAVLATAVPGRAQPAPAGPEASVPAPAGARTDTGPVPPPATLVFANRPIVTFRSAVLSHPPAERAAAARQYLDRLIEERRIGPVTTATVGDTVTVSVGDRDVFRIFPGDVNTLAGETQAQTTATAAAALQLAIDEAVELRTPGRILQAGLLAAGATLLFVGLLWGLRRIHRAGARQVSSTTERQLGRLRVGADLVRASHVPELLQRAVDAGSILLALIVAYMWITFVLRRFPYTRPWGESLRSAFLSALISLGERIMAALPDVVTVLVIFVLVRFVVRLSNYAFNAVEHGRVDLPWLSPEVAPPTKRIVAACLWAMGLVAAYPYFPGASSDAFKGISVFVGLMISLGSSGIMNQVMSGFTITYSRALRVGDFVRIGDLEGTVESLGALALKLKTGRREAITLPNALVVSSPTTNYSRYAEREGVQISTAVTIGYDTPWRQVEALLLLAADRTPGVRKDVPPVVRQTGLGDFYVEYTLLVCPEQPHLRIPILHALHGHILDAFNEYGVQITSPNYEADPEGAKVVPKDNWYAAPAVAPPKIATSPVGAAS
jgi:small-conductance mechanosensitive channel